MCFKIVDVFFIRITRVCVLKRAFTVRISAGRGWCVGYCPSTAWRSVPSARSRASTAARSLSLIPSRSVHLPAQMRTRVAGIPVPPASLTALTTLFLLQNHQYHCPRFPVQCPNQCGTPNIAREDLANHVKDNCGSALVLCPFKDAGCKHRVRHTVRWKFRLLQPQDVSDFVEWADVCINSYTAGGCG